MHLQLRTPTWITGMRNHTRSNNKKSSMSEENATAEVPAPHLSAWQKIKEKITRVEQDFSEEIAHIEAYFASKEGEGNAPVISEEGTQAPASSETAQAAPGGQQSEAAPEGQAEQTEAQSAS